MTELQHARANVPPGAVAQFRPRTNELVRRIVERIERGVDRYSGPVSGRRHRLIHLAVNAGVTHFMEMIENGPRPAPRVDDLFRQMGYGEATDGRDLAAMRAAFRIATRDSWDDLRAFSSAYELTTEALGALGDALFSYVDHLYDQTAIGFEAGEKAKDRDVSSARTRLVTAMLERDAPESVRAAALDAVWPLPEQLVVAAVSGVDPQSTAGIAALPDSVLVANGTDPLIVVTAAEDAATSWAELAEVLPHERMAVSWPVEVGDTPDARRWTERALALADHGVITPEPVIDCYAHRTFLWLHAEPALRRRMCQELLRPLLAETPNSREILSETLLVWLETRDSAPSIAATLGVHPQTIRYRWKRINELFGEDLRDPEAIVQLTMLLKASVPLWKAGDQSDFERFRSAEGA